MIALFCRLYKTKRMQHMSCILLFCIYIPHYSNYLSIFIRYTPTQTEGHIPCLRHQQLYFSDSPVLFPALHLDSPAGTLLQLHLLWGPHRRILSDLHNFRLRLHILLHRQDTTANLWDSRFHQDPATPITSSQAAGYTWLPEGVWKLRFPAAASIRTPFSLAY